MQNKINQRPRKKLGYLAPVQLFYRTLPKGVALAGRIFVEQKNHDYLTRKSKNLPILRGERIVGTIFERTLQV